MKQSGQLKLFKGNASAYGGSLLTTRKGRSRPRPIATRASMHLVLRSSMAKGAMSFRRPQNASKIKRIIDKFSEKYAIQIHSFANVGNHLHIHYQLANRATYKPFIRAITAAIAMAVTGVSRWNRLAKDKTGALVKRLKFWDRRPYTRIVAGVKDFRGLREYIRINQIEGLGYDRVVAKIVREWQVSTGDPF